MSGLELIATVLGMDCVVLAVWRSVWTFPIAIGSVTLIRWLVWQQRLYSDAVLRGFFVAANLYGWAKWRRARAMAMAGAVLVDRLSDAERVRWATGCGAATLVWGGLMVTYTDADYA